MSALMQGKKGVIMGVANAKSIAWGIAEELHKAGAQIAFTYAGEAMERRVKPLAESVNSSLVLSCDVTNDEDIARTFAEIEKEWGEIDFLVHAIAFSDKDELTGRFVDTTRDNFKNTMDISCYSFCAVTKAAEPYLNDDASILTLTYYGSEKVIPSYNVMGVAKAALEASVRYMASDLGEKGIRVNAISAGPIKTLAASGIGGFRKILDYNEAHAPLKKNVSIQDVGKSALFLLSDLSSGVTGEIMYVDAGANTVGLGLAE